MEFSIYNFYLKADCMPLKSGETFSPVLNFIIDLDLSKDFFGNYDPKVFPSSDATFFIN